tara:strand:- start:68 stop:640 length:573 start_codon:yes stop_codon:yes gene_type:complete
MRKIFLSLVFIIFSGLLFGCSNDPDQALLDRIEELEKTSVEGEETAPNATALQTENVKQEDEECTALVRSYFQPITELLIWMRDQGWRMSNKDIGDRFSQISGWKEISDFQYLSDIEECEEKSIEYADTTEWMWFTQDFGTKFDTATASGMTAVAKCAEVDPFSSDEVRGQCINSMTYFLYDYWPSLYRR